MYPVIAFGIGTQEIIVVLIIVVIVFGATKIPQLGSAIGQGIRNYKRGMREVKAEEEEAKRLEADKDSDKSESDKSEDKKAESDKSEKA